MRSRVPLPSEPAALADSLSSLSPPLVCSRRRSCSSVYTAICKPQFSDDADNGLPLHGATLCTASPHTKPQADHGPLIALVGSPPTTLSSLSWMPSSRSAFVSPLAEGRKGVETVYHRDHREHGLGGVCVGGFQLGELESWSCHDDNADPLALYDNQISYETKSRSC